MEISAFSVNWKTGVNGDSFGGENIVVDSESAKGGPLCERISYCCLTFLQKLMLFALMIVCCSISPPGYQWFMKIYLEVPEIFNEISFTKQTENKRSALHLLPLTVHLNVIDIA